MSQVVDGIDALRQGRFFPYRDTTVQRGHFIQRYPLVHWNIPGCICLPFFGETVGSEMIFALLFISYINRDGDSISDVLPDRLDLASSSRLS